MKKSMMVFALAIPMATFTMVPVASAQHHGYDRQGHYDHGHDNFRRGASRGGYGGNYNNGRYDTRHGNFNDGQYHPNGIGPGKGAGIGAAGGAVLGALFGGGVNGALIGGGVGAGIGAIAGKSHQDHQKRDCYQYGHC